LLKKSIKKLRHRNKLKKKQNRPLFMRRIILENEGKDEDLKKKYDENDTF